MLSIIVNNMKKKCFLYNNKVKTNNSYCWIHTDKPRQINERKEKKRIKEVLKYYGKYFRTGYKTQLYKFREDISRKYEKERRRFSKIDAHYKSIMKIWEELADEEYQIIPNKMKRFMQPSK